MSDRALWVFEVGVEEIPSRFLDGLAQDFFAAVQTALAQVRLPCDNPQLLYTPRRLAVEAQVGLTQTASTETVRGPQVSAAYRDGQPTPALAGFLRRVGATVDALRQETAGGKEYLVADVQAPVRAASVVLPELAQMVLGNLPQPRSMRWRDDDVRFIRPVRWILMVLGDEVLSGEALGVRFDGVTFGNRTDHPQSIRVESASAYRRALEIGRVEAVALRRRTVIEETSRRLADQQGGVAQIDAELLAEVSNLVEWPTPFLGSFDPQFLEVPEAVLVTSMRVHQRYFPVTDANGRLLAHFVAVRNGVGEDLDVVRRGNEKVLRARLSDARYFFLGDRQRRLADAVGRLGEVTVHAQLGTYRDKVERILALFNRTRDWWNFTEAQGRQFERAAWLYKCDLLTQVVGEFPELQGEMGGIYAQLDGEEDEVVWAIRDQYRPSAIQDRLPQGRVGMVLGLLDRIDTLMAFYQANLRASGSEDPFGLRRAALGVARLASETPVLADHDMRELIAQAAQLVQAPEEVAEAVYGLVRARLITVLLEAEWPRNVVEAVLAREFPWRDLPARLEFAQRHQAEADAVAESYRRIARIVKGVETASQPYQLQGIEAELAQRAERTAAMSPNRLEEWWQETLELAPVVARFFDEVLVMDPDPAVRSGRIGLLRQVMQAMGQYLDWDAL